MGHFCFKLQVVSKLVAPLALFCFSWGSILLLILCWLSDDPKFSVTRICADDCRSALKFLKVLKRQASIFRLAASFAGLHLKPAKYVLIVTACNLTEHLIASIRNWLSFNVPEFKDIVIAESGFF